MSKPLDTALSPAAVCLVLLLCLTRCCLSDCCCVYLLLSLVLLLYLLYCCCVSLAAVSQPLLSLVLPLYPVLLMYLNCCCVSPAAVSQPLLSCTAAVSCTAVASHPLLCLDRYCAIKLFLTTAGIHHHNHTPRQTEKE